MIQDSLIKSYGRTLNWSVAGLFAHDRFMWELLRICNTLKVEVPIHSVYGGVPCLFQGGRIPLNDAHFDDVRTILKKYDDLGISCRLTFSNMMLTEDDLNDELSNNILAVLNSLSNTRHGVIVAYDPLVHHIHKKYPNLYTISSIVKPIEEVGLGNDTIDYYIGLLDLYDYVTVNPNKINDGKFLKEMIMPERIIFNVNSRCVSDCPNSKKHNDLIMEINTKSVRGEDYSKEVEKLTSLLNSCTKVHEVYPLKGSQMSYTELEDLARRGYTHFSIEGRDFDGRCFIRDVGEYVFNYYLYDRIACSIMGGVV